MEGRVGLPCGWPRLEEGIPVVDVASLSLVRERVREVGSHAGLAEVDTASLVTVASELAQNHLRHARAGRVLVREHVRGADRGVEVVAADAGDGIGDVSAALAGASATAANLGAGLSGVLELADEVDMDVRRGEGTCVWARRFGVRTGRRRRVGIFGRALPGEPCSGDDATFVWAGRTLLAAVVDGLGHGAPAREASARACRVLGPDDDDVQAVVLRCDSALRGTRGGVMAVARVEDGCRTTASVVGDAGGRVAGPRGEHRFAGTSFVLGSPGSARRVLREERRLEPWDVVVLFTDGILSRLDLTVDRELLREHPVVVAQRIVERFARATDDAMVLVIG